MNQIPTILYQNHTAEQAAHSGVSKTFSKIAQHYFWPGYYKDIAKFVQSCKDCQTCKPRAGKNPGAMKPRQVNSIPGQIWYTDLMGPFPTSSRGNQHLLVFQCHMSRYVELIPLRNTTAKTISAQINKAILSRYGGISAVISDNATVYNNQVIQDMSQQFGFKHQNIGLYNPQANIVERVLKSMIRCYIEKHTTWNLHLPWFQFAII